MFEVPKPMMEIASRDHIMFFLGLRPIAFGPKFISNYSKTKNGDRQHTHGRTHGVIKWADPRGMVKFFNASRHKPPEAIVQRYAIFYFQ